jgi:5-methylcytosine-specific restriction endonuclease McrA
VNKKLTAKERGLIKGAIRRVFARAELRQSVVDASRVEHSDVNRPRVKKWSLCASCEKIVPTYTVAVDHKDPVIPISTTFEQMSLDEVVDRMWCDIKNLQVLCESCHNEKTKAERALRPKKPKKAKGKRARYGRR